MYPSLENIIEQMQQDRTFVWWLRQQVRPSEQFRDLTSYADANIEPDQDESLRRLRTTVERYGNANPFAVFEIITVNRAKAESKHRNHLGEFTLKGGSPAGASGGGFGSVGMGGGATRQDLEDIFARQLALAKQDLQMQFRQMQEDERYRQQQQNIAAKEAQLAARSQALEAERQQLNAQLQDRNSNAELFGLAGAKVLTGLLQQHAPGLITALAGLDEMVSQMGGTPPPADPAWQQQQAQQQPEYPGNTPEQDEIEALADELLNSGMTAEELKMLRETLKRNMYGNHE